MKLLEMQGNPCPIPVIQAKKELADPNSTGVIVQVDNQVAIQNLEKMAKGLGYLFSQEPAEEGLYRAVITKQGHQVVEDTAEVCIPCAVPVQGGATVLIASNHMGRGSEELGKMLIKGFIFSLSQMPVPPKAVIFINSGVELACQGSNAIGDLEELVKLGTEVVACGTCLNYFGLTEKLTVGQIGDMYAITSRLVAGAPVVSV